MDVRALWPVLILLLASCVPQAYARQELPDDPAELTVEAVRQLPAERIPEVIDTVTATGAPAEPFQAGASNDRALDCLTAAIYYEARSEPLDGQRAVAQVVLNRVRHRAFPRSVCGVVFQGRERRTGCQFSFTCDGSMHRGREPGAWARAQDVASAALSGYVFAPVGLATHFHTTAINPWWASSMRRAITVGAHVFYRWPGRWGNPLAFRAPYQGYEGGVPSPVAQTAEARDPNLPAPATEVVMGVTIHRSAARPVPAARIAEAAQPPVTVSRSVRVGRGSQAVTVHRGGSAPPFMIAETEAGGAADGSAAAR